MSSSPYLWGTQSFPLQPTTGAHIYGPGVQTITQGYVELLYGETTANYNLIGPDTVTENLLQLDLFLLPNSAPLPVETSTITTLPFRNALALATQNEGIVVYGTQNAAGQTFLHEVFGTGTSNGISFSAPKQIEGPLTGVIETPISLSVIDSNAGALTNYAVAWDLYNSTAETYSIDFQIFNANNSVSSPIEIPLPMTGVPALPVSGVTSLPGWEFRSIQGHYELAVAEPDPNNAGDQLIHFQNYNSDGNQNHNAGAPGDFNVTADLTTNAATFGTGTTNEITLDEKDPTLHTGNTAAIKFAEFSGSGTNANPSAYAVAWNETVTGSNGTFDQVELAAHSPTGTTTFFQTPFLIADANPQSIKLEVVNDVGYLAYGDDTGTTLVEFDSSGTILGQITDPTSQQYQNISVLGDGRVAIVYDDLTDPSNPNDGTSQIVTQIYDFRTAGLAINDSALTDGQDKFIAGTQFSDSFTGENGVNDLYYFVGSATTTPTDYFIGGNHWNIALFADPESDFTITSLTNSNGSGTITSNDAQHAGALNFSNVQELVFNSSVDPRPLSNGTVVASGGTVVMLGHDLGTEAFTIAGSGTTLELSNTHESGTATFTGSPNTLQLDSPVEFTGHIAGLAAGDVIDLSNVTANNVAISGTKVTVTTTGAPVILTLSSAFTNTFVIQSDGNNGSDLVVHGTVTWASATSGDYATASNWTPTFVPPDLDNAAITHAGTYTVTSAVNETAKSIVTAAGATLAITGDTFDALTGTGTGTNAGTITVADGATLALGTTSISTTVDNTGAIKLNANGSTTDLIISGDVTLEGAGKLTLSNNAANGIGSDGNPATLTNDGNTISGAGGIEDSNLTLDNETKGVIDGDGTTQVMTIETGANTVTNAGIIEGTTAQGITVNSTVSNSNLIEALGTGALVSIGGDIANTTKGVILASGTGAHVELPGADIAGGTLATTGTNAVIETVGGFGAILDGSGPGLPVNNSGSLLINDNSNLQLFGTLNNTGTITIDSTSHITELLINNSVTLAGTGHVTLNGSPDSVINSNVASSTLTNVANIISGAGTIGDTELTLNNNAKGVIDATSATTALVIRATSVTNIGLLEATGAGGLHIISTSAFSNSNLIEALGTNAEVDIESTIGQTATGVILASGIGAQVDFVNGSGLVGGSLKTANGGVINVNDPTTFEGPLTNAGTVDVGSSGSMATDGTLTNTGTITVASGGEIEIAPNVTLMGTGHVVLTGGSILSNVVSTLTNDSTISGFGTIGDNNLTIANQPKGVIDGNSATSVLTLSAGGGVTNAGILEGTGAVGLDIASNVSNSNLIEALGTNAKVSIEQTVTNSTAGVLLASGVGAHVDLDGATIAGGTLKTASGGAIDIGSGNGESTFDGTSTAVTNTGLLNVTEGGALLLEGSVFNNASTGIISVAGSASPTDIVIASSLTLQGGGKISLTGADSGIGSNGSPVTLTNVDNTISGFGSIGDNELTIVNQLKGVIDGNGAGVLHLDTLAVTNAGILEGANAQGLEIFTAVANQNVIEALGTNARVDVTHTSTITDMAGKGVILASGTNAHVDFEGNTTVVGGTLKTMGTGAQIEVINSSIVSFDGSQGTNSLTNTGAVHIVSGEAEFEGTINNNGIITVADGQAIQLGDQSVATTTFHNTGSVLLGGPSSTTQLGIDNTVDLTGGGKITFSDSSGSNSLQGINDAGVLTNVDNTITGAVTFQDGTGLTFDNQAKGIIDATFSDHALTFQSLATPVLNEGTIEASGHLVISETTINDDALSAMIKTIASGAVIDLDTATISGSGTISTVAHSTIETENGDTSTLAATTITNAGTIGAEDGNLTVTGAINNTGTLDATDTSTLTIIDAVTGAGAGTISSNGTLEFEAASSAKVSFLDSSGVLLLENATVNTAKFTGTIAHPNGGDQTIDLGAISYTTGDSQLSFAATSTGGVLTITDGTHSTPELTLTFVGHGLTSADFSGQTDGHTHLDVLFH